jgi:hypothetical protein
MANNPLIIGATQKQELFALRARAAAHPVDLSRVKTAIETPDGKRRHMDHMDSQTIDLPMAYLVTFSIETGQPCGPCRHLSLSSQIKGRAPIPEAVWMVCQELGFVGETAFDGCHVYIEELQRGPDPVKDRHKAVNVIQPIAMAATSPYAAS